MKGLCEGGDELPQIKVYFVVRLTGKRRRRFSLENENSPSFSAFHNGFNAELNLNETHLHSLFWAIPQSPNFVFRCFGTFCLLHLHRRCWGIYTWRGIRLKNIFVPNFSCINTPTISSRLFLLLAPPMKIERSVPKRQHIKFRRRGITQKKEYNVQNTAEVLNQEWITFVLQICVRIEVAHCDFIVHYLGL